ncbi:MAG: hypothetical protein K0U75_17590 [Actinomycetia bacterium]|nr:hypothetical protein [Actinomycetes bacterium]
MSAPSRKKRTPVFDASNESKEMLDDALDDLKFPPKASGDADTAAPEREAQPATNPAHLSVVPWDQPHLGAVPATAATPGPAVYATPATDAAPATGGAPATVAAPVTARRSVRGGKAKSAPRRRPHKPPEAAIAYPVYLRLKKVSENEKIHNRGSARPMGTIVMDALERHAATLMKLWATPELASAPAEGSLFIRRAATSDAAPPPRRIGSVHTITLSGITGANAELLDKYAQEWNAGSRAALVEEALRLEFGMPHSSDDAADQDGS